MFEVYIFNVLIIQIIDIELFQHLWPKQLASKTSLWMNRHISSGSFGKGQLNLMISEQEEQPKLVSVTGDVLFNNAGIGNPANTIDLISKEDWNNLININLNGSFYCAKEAFHYMKSQCPKGGRIINNGSISAHVPRPGSAPYTVSKHAITGLTKSISLDGRKYNVVCSQIDIGNAGTEMTKKMSKGIIQANGNILKEPVINVNHIAKAVYDIAELPLNTNIQFMTIMASSMPYIGRG